MGRLNFEIRPCFQPLRSPVPTTALVAFYSSNISSLLSSHHDWGLLLPPQRLHPLSTHNAWSLLFPYISRGFLTSLILWGLLSLYNIRGLLYPPNPCSPVLPQPLIPPVLTKPLMPRLSPQPFRPLVLHNSEGLLTSKILEAFCPLITLETSFPPTLKAPSLCSPVTHNHWDLFSHKLWGFLFPHNS